LRGLWRASYSCPQGRAATGTAQGVPLEEARSDLGENPLGKESASLSPAAKPYEKFPVESTRGGRKIRIGIQAMLMAGTAAP